jgi:membrane-associated protease RseP (regulator of RpoE activity)
MRRSWRNATIGAAVVALLIGGALTMAAEKEKSAAKDSGRTAASTEKGRVEQIAYLGIAIEPLSPAFASQMPEMFRNGQGVLVASVVEGSPAAKAGIKPHDVLTTYADQKLFSPEQLARLVRSDQVGRQVKLGIVREGKSEQIKVTLGEYEVEHPNSPTRGLPHLWHWNWRMPRWFSHQTAPRERDRSWESFDSMTIKNLGNNRFQAEIGYMDQEGKLQTREFEGTREEIDKAILAQKDLPASEREHLLRGLDMPGEEWLLPRVHVFPGHGLSWDFDRPDRTF